MAATLANYIGMKYWYRSYGIGFSYKLNKLVDRDSKNALYCYFLATPRQLGTHVPARIEQKKWHIVPDAGVPDQA